MKVGVLLPMHVVPVRHRAAAGSRGQSLVEFALLMPILALMFVGVVDFSRLYHSYTAATNAARVGAEVAMNHAATDVQITAAVNNEAAPGVTFEDIAINPNAAGRTVGSTVQVTVTYVFSPFTPLVASFWGGGPLSLDTGANGRVY